MTTENTNAHTDQPTHNQQQTTDNIIKNKLDKPTQQKTQTKQINEQTTN